MCSNVQASNSSQEAIEKLIKDGMQCPSKTKTNQVHRSKKMKYHLQSAVEHCTFWQLTTKGEHQYNQLSEEEFHEAAGA
jgi:hypothetical protein